jgi:hypothetical protein
LRGMTMNGVSLAACWTMRQKSAKHSDWRRIKRN